MRDEIRTEVLAAALNSFGVDCKWAIVGETYDSLQWLNVDIPKPSREEFAAAIAAAIPAIELSKLRFERNKLLAECDWVVVKYKEQNLDIPQQWANYRQALRDITDNYTSVVDVVWPAKPE